MREFSAKYAEHLIKRHRQSHPDHKFRLIMRVVQGGCPSDMHVHITDSHQHDEACSIGRANSASSQVASTWIAHAPYRCIRLEGRRTAPFLPEDSQSPELPATNSLKGIDMP